ncbi:MAG TPA: hypothetical protein VGL13_12645 [Polyangiaceae bacterium]
MSKSSRLAVLVDGKRLPEEDARALWKRFSEHLDAHRLDFNGFAKSEGFLSVRPESQGGEAVLVVSTGAPSQPRKPARR